MRKRPNLAMWGMIAVLGLVLAVVSWFAWTGPQAEAPRARVFRDYDICLLTDGSGLNDAHASAAWKQLQETSTRTNARVSYLPVTGEQTEARAAQLLATQVQQRCRVIVATGVNQIAAANNSRQSYPGVFFLPSTDPAGEDLTGQILEHVPPA
jgi:basic membrane lipoprotein Med (substrate-binding protein (PBP1-ABC) superfamily)